MRKCFCRVLRLFPVTILSRRPEFYAGLADVEVVGCKLAPREVYHQIPIFSFRHCLPIDVPYSSSYRIYQDVKGIKCRDVPVKVVLFAEFLFVGFRFFINAHFFADVYIGGEVCCRGTG